MVGGRGLTQDHGPQARKLKHTPKALDLAPVERRKARKWACALYPACKPTCAREGTKKKPSCVK